MIEQRTMLTHHSIYLDSEELLGKWFMRIGKRDEIFLVSKFGIEMEGIQFKGINSSGKYCKRSCEASLKRLGINSIDLCGSLELNLQSITDLSQITRIVSILRHPLRKQREQWPN